MKWFFASNQASVDNISDDWELLIKVAVLSCRDNTDLQPCFIYDGIENRLTDWLKNKGVEVFFHRSSLYDFLLETCRLKYADKPGFDQVAPAAFLRVDIPDLVADEDFVLYTDCDVMFLKDPVVDLKLPKLLACAPQMNRGDYNDLNSGVMLMNIPMLRDDLPNFKETIIGKEDFLSGYDQASYRIHYGDRYDLLPDELNWKPYWGIHSEACIIHFHGPKPSIASRLLNDPEFKTWPIYHQLFNRNPEGYAKYIAEWNRFMLRIES